MRERGIEPRPSAWEAEVLPLNYSRQRHAMGKVNHFSIYSFKEVYWGLFGRVLEGILCDMAPNLQVIGIVRCERAANLSHWNTECPGNAIKAKRYAKENLRCIERGLISRSCALLTSFCLVMSKRGHDATLLR